MRRGTPRRSEQNQLLDEEVGKIPELPAIPAVKKKPNKYTAVQQYF
jgi:hypothetical protein